MNTLSVKAFDIHLHTFIKIPDYYFKI